MPLRIVFMGTPEFAVPSLLRLHEDGHQIAGVITAPDKLGGRGGHQLLESAVKRVAQTQQFKILQPTNLKNREFINELKELRADLQVVVAFRMLPEVVWSMPPLGTMNLHGSLLPAYRGAAPINWAIIKGERSTGVTTFLLQHAIDTGDILLQESLSIGPDETAGELHDRMMHLGAKVVSESVRGIEQKTLKGTPQDHARVSNAPKILHETCQIDFNHPGPAVHHFIRGLSPYPTAWTIVDGLQLNIFKSKLIDTDFALPPGSILADKGILTIACATGQVQLLEVQLQGKRKMSVRDFLNGYKILSTTVERKA